MTDIIIQNWPDKTADLRMAIKRLVDDGRTYREVIEQVKKDYLRIQLLKMRRETQFNIARRCGICRSNLNYLKRKYQL